MTAITLVHNPSAGIQTIAAPTLIHLLGRAGYRVHYVARRRTANLTADLVRGTPLVAVAGGDGTVGAVLRAGANLPRTVAIIPSGVANNIALSLGARRGLPETVTGWRHGRRRPVHLAEIELAGERLTMVESIGIGALAAATQDMIGRRTPFFGRRDKLADTRRHFRDAIAAAPALRRLIIDDNAASERPIFAEILNIPMTGPNLCLAGRATLGDDQLHVVHASEAHRQAICDWLDAGAEPAARPALPTAHAKAITVEWAGGPLRLDDRMSPRTEGRLTIASRRTRLSLLAPA